MKSFGICLQAASEQMYKMSIIDMRLKITDLRLQSRPVEASQLK